MKVWRPRLVVNEEDALTELEKGQHVLVSNGPNEFWVQVLAFVKQNIYLGMVCSRMNQSFGRILEFKPYNVLSTIN